MAYRNKTYVCFDGDNDMWSYAYMKGWKQNDNSTFEFYDAHDINTALDSSSEETIKRRLRERLNNSKVLIVLIGEHTRNLYKFVRWEIESAISMGLPIIAVNLNGEKNMDSLRCPPILRDTLAIHIPYGAKIMQYALEKWPESHYDYKSQGKTGAYHYKESVYNNLGL